MGKKIAVFGAMAVVLSVTSACTTNSVGGIGGTGGYSSGGYNSGGYSSNYGGGLSNPLGSSGLGSSGLGSSGLGSSGSTVRDAALGALIGGAAMYVGGGEPWVGAAVGGVVGAGIDYFDSY